MKITNNQITKEDMNSISIINQLKWTYKLSNILVYPQIHLSAYLKDLSRESPKSALKNTWERKYVFWLISCKKMDLIKKYLKT